jgi:hypothetical protein
MKKKILVVLLALAMVFSLSACSLFGGTKTVAGYERTDGVEDYTTTSDGRKVDGYQIAFKGDTVSTAWFKFTVNSVKFTDEYEDITADSGYQLAVANITVKSTYDGDMPLYYNDFWSHGILKRTHGLTPTSLPCILTATISVIPSSWRRTKR